MSIPETALVPLDHRKALEAHLEKALKTIVEAMDSNDIKTALAAARWVAEMVLGKPNQAIQIEHGAKELAVELVKALREAMSQARALPPPIRIVDGSVRVLGVPETTTPGNDNVTDGQVTESVTTTARSHEPQTPFEVVGTDDDFPG